MSPFAKINSFLNTWTSDLMTLFATLAAIGFIFCAFMVWKGDEENVPKFKKGLTWTGIALIVTILAPAIVKWIQSGVN